MNHQLTQPANQQLPSVQPVEVSASALAFYRRIQDPMQAVDQFGRMLYESKMFGCHNLDQGRTLALTCMTQGLTPVEISRTYHIIGGNLSMRADAMLAIFRMKYGGDHEQLERTPDRAAIRLVRGDKSQDYSITWDEAKQEPFVFQKDGKTLKTNWATPRARMQMLWARVVSDGVRAFCPEVVAGIYTPEEMGDVLDVEYSVETPQPQQPQQLPPFTPQQPVAQGFTPEEKMESPPPVQPAQPVQQVASQNSQPEPVQESQSQVQPQQAPQAQQPQLQPQPDPQKGPTQPFVNQEQLDEIARLIQETGIPQQKYNEIVFRDYHVTHTKDLTAANGDDLIIRLTKLRETIRSNQEFDQFADRVASGGSSPNQ